MFMKHLLSIDLLMFISLSACPFQSLWTCCSNPGVFVLLNQGRPITPVYAMAHNVQRIPTAGGLYGPGFVPITNYTANTAALAALQKNAAMTAAAYGGYAGYAVPQAFPAAAFQLPLHDIYQTY